MSSSKQNFKAWYTIDAPVYVAIRPTEAASRIKKNLEKNVIHLFLKPKFHFDPMKLQ